MEVRSPLSKEILIERTKVEIMMMAIVFPRLLVFIDI